MLDARRLLLTAALALLAPVPDLSEDAPAGFEESVAASELDSPTAVAVLPDARLLVTLKDGALVLVDGGVNTTIGEVPVAVCPSNEVGLLGIALDPEFDVNGWIYLSRTKPGTGDPCSAEGRVNEIVRVTMAPGGSVDLASLTVILTGIRTDEGAHIGGGLRVGSDGCLYLGTGDTGVGGTPEGGSPGDATNPYAQDLTALEGKVLRVNRDGSIPADNPFVNAAPARPEVYAYGFRNAWRLAIDPLTGKLWGVDVGDFTMEEVNRVKPGGNYSWPHAEGNLPQGGIPEGEIAPALAYPHGHGPTSYGSACTALGIAPAGFGELAGQLFFGDLGTNLVYRAPLDAQREGLAGTPVPFLVSAAAPVDIVFGPAGPATVQKALYYVAINAGEVRRVTAPIVYSDQGLPGTKLVLRVKPKQTAVLLSKGAVSAGGEEGDPLTFGATLRLTGAGFDTTLSLPAARWKAIGPKGGPPKVYRYLDPKSEAGPVRNLTIVQGKSLHLTAAGEALGLDLTQDPGVVSVELTIGALRKRLEFGGTVKYIAGKSLVATKAPPPRD